MDHLQSAETATTETAQDPTDERIPLTETGPSLATERRRTRRIGNYWALFTLFVFFVGMGGGYLLGKRSHPGMRSGSVTSEEMAGLDNQVNPPQGYSLPVRYGDIGPQLLEAGAIDYDSFVQVYERVGQPLSEEQQAILREGSENQIVIDRQNAYFLLNFFWAFGLANQNRILTEGPMANYNQGDIMGFASTGGWTMATKPVKEFYSSVPIAQLTPARQAQLEEIAGQIYRPCCNNPTHFPDCNHGMAMLGLLELMAFQGASQDEMFTAAKYANAFWYPRQSMELASFFKANQKIDFTQVDAPQLLSAKYSSGSGFQTVHQWLVANGVLEQAPGGGTQGCGV